MLYLVLAKNQLQRDWYARDMLILCFSLSRYKCKLLNSGVKLKSFPMLIISSQDFVWWRSNVFDSLFISCSHACRTAQPLISDEYEAADGDAFGTLTRFDLIQYGVFTMLWRYHYDVSNFLFFTSKKIMIFSNFTMT